MPALKDIRSLINSQIVYESGERKLALLSGYVTGARLAKLLVETEWPWSLHPIAAKTWMGDLRNSGMLPQIFILELQRGSEYTITMSVEDFPHHELMEYPFCTLYSRGINDMVEAVWGDGKSYFLGGLFSLEESKPNHLAWTDQAIQTALAMLAEAESA